MFKVNDYIMYGMTGVCQVVDITKESFIDNLQKEYYVLKYIYSNDNIIKKPCNLTILKFIYYYSMHG